MSRHGHGGMDYKSRRPDYKTPCADFENINVTFKDHINTKKIQKSFEQLFPHNCDIQDGDHYDDIVPLVDLDPTKDRHFIPKPRG